MSTNTISPTNTAAENTALANDQLRKIANRVVLEMELAIAKVAAHHAEPTAFPLPSDADSVEQILRKRFDQLRPEQRQYAAAKVLPALQSRNGLSERRFRDLASIDLGISTPIAEQVRSLTLPDDLALAPAALTGISEDGGFPPIPTVPTVPSGTNGGAVSSISKLEFRIQRVKCVDETGPAWPGSDEILLGANTVDETGDVKKVPSFKVGDFDQGNTKRYTPPKRLTLFDIREGPSFPKRYFVTLVLAEEDQGGFPDFVNGLFKQVKAKVEEYVADAIARGKPVEIAIALAVNYIVGKIFEILTNAWNDDIFPPKTLSVRINSATHRFPGGATVSPEDVAVFKGHNGKYEVFYDWRLLP